MLVYTDESVRTAEPKSSSKYGRGNLELLASFLPRKSRIKGISLVGAS